MGRKGEGPRKPRLALPAYDNEDGIQKHSSDTNDSQEKKLKAIAQAAAVLSGTAPETLITPCAAPGTASNDAVFKAPPPKPRQPSAAGEFKHQSLAKASGSPTGSNPLAGILGYGGEEEDEEQEEGDEAEAAEDGFPNIRQLALSEGKEAENQSKNHRDGLAESGQDLDAELASFLSELETSGLLKDDTAIEEAGRAAEDAGRPALAKSLQPLPATLPAAAALEEGCLKPEQPTAQASEAEEHAGALAGTSAGATEPPQHLGEEGEEPGAADDAVAAEQSTAEQRVLGDVPGAEGWCCVKDMGSGQIYYWHQETDEVAWAPPEGATARLPAGAEATAGVEGPAEACALEASEQDLQQPGQGEAEYLAPSRDSMPAEGDTNGVQQPNEGIKPDAATAEALAATRAESAAAVCKLLVRPSEDAVAAAAAVAQRCTDAAGSWLEMVPQVVRLAIEAQSLATLLSLFSQQQTVAADARSSQAALSWEGLQSTLSNALASLDAQLPGAVQAAHCLHSSPASGPQAGAQQQGQPSGRQQLQEQEQAGPDPGAAQVTAEGPVTDCRDNQGEEMEKAEEQGLPPLPPEPQVQAGVAAATLHSEGGHGLDVQQQQQQVHAGTLVVPAAGSEGERGRGAEGPEESPPLPPEDVSMELDDDVAAPASTGAMAAAHSSGAALGLAAYGEGASSDEEGEIATSSREMQQLPQQPGPSTTAVGPAEGPVPASAAPAAVSVGEAAPPSTFPWPPWFGAFPPPLPLPIPLPGPLPFHPLFLPPVGAFPPPYPYPPLPGAYPAASEEAQVQPTQPPLPATEEAPAVLQGKRREYSANAQPAAASCSTAEQPPLPANTEGPNASVEPGDLVQGSQALSSDSAALKKRRQEKAAIGAKKPKALKLDKGTVSLISKWQAVQKQVQKLEQAEEKAAATEADPEAKFKADEERKLREAEEWRLQQLRNGTVADNANFAPLVGNWRDKLKKPKKKKLKAAAAVNDAQQSTQGVPDLDALSEGLPRGWRAMFDKGSCKVYYGNLKTKETQWERPD